MAMPALITVPRYTVDDLESFPEDGNRYELLDGILLVTPAPRVVHQEVVVRLQALLVNTLSIPRLGMVVGPGVVSLPPGTQLEPDILVYPYRFKGSDNWQLISERWLAVEVLSPSSKMYDREFKRDAYLAMGVSEVWLVDIDERQIEMFSSNRETIVAKESFRWRVPTLELIVPIDLAWVLDG